MKYLKKEGFTKKFIFSFMERLFEEMKPKIKINSNVLAGEISEIYHLKSSPYFDQIWMELIELSEKFLKRRLKWNITREMNI